MTYAPKTFYWTAPYAPGWDVSPSGWYHRDERGNLRYLGASILESGGTKASSAGRDPQQGIPERCCVANKGTKAQRRANDDK